MQKFMMLIAIMFSFVLAACQTATTTRNTTSSEGVSVGNDWKNSETGREFRLRSGVTCKAWNHESPTLTDELSKHFSSSQQSNIKSLRREEENFGQLCREVILVNTKKQARSWLAKRRSIGFKFGQLQDYWIKDPLRWSNAEEARIWYAFNCRRNIGKVAQVIARVIAENNPWNADSARKKAQSINAKASNVCSRGYDGVEEKFISESKGAWESFISLFQLSRK